MNWKEFLKHNLIITIILINIFLITLVVVYFFLIYVEKRTGASITDPLLKILPSVNVSVPLFILTYAGTIVGVFYVLRNPSLTILTLITYTLILWLRMICMYFTPLEPPDGIIPLRDFILESTFYSGNVNLKDLFFSGHTASMFMFFTIISNKVLKIIYLIITILVACLLLIQHAHYTIDVLVAPIMVWFAYYIANFVYRFYFKEKKSKFA
jgi:membrane-associated phospholipid phosphatase